MGKQKKDSWALPKAIAQMYIDKLGSAPDTSLKGVASSLRDTVMAMASESPGLAARVSAAIQAGSFSIGPYGLRFIMPSSKGLQAVWGKEDPFRGFTITVLAGPDWEEKYVTAD